MEFHGFKPGAATVMGHDAGLLDLLRQTFADNEIDYAVETGTHMGTGSTRFISEAFLQTRVPKLFATIECDFGCWQAAVDNLRQFPFVECLWGCSVDTYGARVFLRTDHMLRNHQDYLGIWIDDVVDPISAYTNEVMASHGTTDLRWAGENLLAKFLVQHRNATPLVVLDSAGGIGWYEFETVENTMGGRPYFLLLDDTKHIKHVRTLAAIRQDPRFTLLGAEADWALAAYG